MDALQSYDKVWREIALLDSYSKWPILFFDICGMPAVAALLKVAWNQRNHGASYLEAIMACFGVILWSFPILLNLFLAGRLCQKMTNTMNKLRGMFVCVLLAKRARWLTFTEKYKLSYLRGRNCKNASIGLQVGIFNVLTLMAFLKMGVTLGCYLILLSKLAALID